MKPFLKTRGDDRGISLMETMVVIGIMTMIMVVMSQIFAVNDRLMSIDIARVDDENGANVAVRNFGELTRNAMAVVASQSINGTAYSTDASTLVLQLPSLDSSGNVIAASYDYVAFYRDATRTTEIWTDTAPAAGSVRQSGKKRLTAFNSVMTFSYNAHDVSQATRVSVFVVNSQVVRGQTLLTKAWTSVHLRNL